METEQRKLTRLLAQDTAYAVLRPDFKKIGKIKNMSEGGLVFQYIAYEVQHNDASESEIDIFISEEGGFHLLKIPCRIIYDSKFDECQTSTHHIEMRWCGVQFGELTEEQAADLEFFLGNYTIRTL